MQGAAAHVQIYASERPLLHCKHQQLRVWCVCSHASFFLLYLTLPSSSAGPPPLVLLLPPLQLLHEGPPRRPYPGRLPLQPRPLLQLGAGLGGLPVDLLDLPLRCCHPKAEMTFPGSVAKKTI